MTVKCVEPAEARAHDPNYTYLVQVAATNELLFPHVDSCLAIAFELTDGRMIGGHVGMQMPGANNLDPYGNATNIAGQMMGLLGAAQIRRVILVGDGNWEKDFIGDRNVVDAIIQQTGCADTLFVETGSYGGGVDFSLNPRRSMVFIQRCVQNRPLVFQKPYAMITGHQTKRLR